MHGCEEEVANGLSPDISIFEGISNQNYLIMLKPFFVRENKVLKKINPGDVICLSTEGNYTRIFLVDKTYYMLRSTLSGALKKLPPDMFIKIHRSYIASIYHIDDIHKDHLLIGGESVPIAKQYYKSLIDKLNVIE